MASEKRANVFVRILARGPSSNDSLMHKDWASYFYQRKWWNIEAMGETYFCLMKKCWSLEELSNSSHPLLLLQGPEDLSSESASIPEFNDKTNIRFFSN